MARRYVGLAVLLVALLATAFMVAAARNFDFHAFYCAGSVARGGADPYLTEPLRTCERSVTAGEFVARMHDAALPAPFPGYVIAPLEAISALPFPIASKIWTVLLLACIACAVVALMALTRLSAAFIAAALCLSIGIPSLGFGELVPIFIAALSVGALFARDGKWIWAAVCAGAGLVEPHIGIPICFALFVWRKQTRVPLTFIAAVVATVSLLVLGIGGNIEYLTRVLPFHALSEIGSDRQLSVTVILHGLGASNGLALEAGLATYLLMCAAGVLLARRAAEHFKNDAFLVVTPAAAAMVGGSFLHVTQIAAAIPLALLLLQCAPAYRRAVLACVILLAIPWLWVYQPLLIELAVVLAAFLAWEGAGYRVDVALASACSVFVLLMLLNWWSGGHVPDGHTIAAAVTAIPARYAEASWAQANLGYWSSGTAASFAYRAPTWLGLFGVVGITVLAAYRRSHESIAQASRARLGITA